MQQRVMTVLALVLAAAVTTPAWAGEENVEQRLEKLERELAELHAAQPPNRPADTDVRVYWRDGLRFDTHDGRFKLRLGGRIHYDWLWATGSDFERHTGTDLRDGALFRRARINLQGDIFDDLFFKTQYDFADGSAAFKDVYLGMKNIPYVGTFTAGQFKEPFSLEELTSSNNITFMERSLANVFSPSRNVGFGAKNTLFDNRVTWSAGMFRQADDQGLSRSDGGYNLTYRLTGLPMYEDNGERLVHLGFAHSFRTPKDTVRVRQRPEMRTEQRFVDTGSFDADRLNLVGAEAAMVYGPLSLQSEYITAMLDADAVRDPNFHGVYVQASYFLTGERRPYSTSSGAFGRVRPKANFRQDGGWGAWEIAARYSYLDLNDGDLRGGRIQNATVGLNWYLTPNARVMWNYVRSCVDRDWSAEADLFAMRMQIDF